MLDMLRRAYPWLLANALLFGAVTCAVHDRAPAPQGEIERQEQAAAEAASTAPAALVESGAASAELAAIRARFGDAAGAAEGLRFERRGAGVAAVIEPAALARAAMPAHVVLPARATAPVEVRDATGDVAVAFALEGVDDAAIEIAGGVAIYRAALGGASLVHRVRATGVEDFVFFPARPARESVSYRLELGEAVAGLRLVARTLEVVDARGVPRLRVEPPYVLGASGARHPAELAIAGCEVDRDRRAPWRRLPTAPGARSCELTVSWEGAAVEYPALLDPVWTTTANQMIGRSGHTSTTLPSGEVLLAGGFDASGAALDSAEMFCPPELCGLGIFGAALPGALQTARGGHTATLLATNDRVLVTGGRTQAIGGTVLGSAEIYDVGPQSFRTVDAMSAARVEHTATRLGAAAGDKVLVAGGVSLATAELFDPVSEIFEAPLNMTGKRRAHVAVLAGNGKVLLAGGIDDQLALAVSHADLYDPTAGTFAKSADNMTSVRAFAAAARLEDAQGSVLITGGRNESGFTFETAEIYRPSTDTFQSQLIQMQTKRAFHTATTLLGEGKVLLTGGFDGANDLANTEVFDLLSPNAFTLATTMSFARSRHAASLLNNGQVLVTGGETAPEHYGEILQRADGDPCTDAGECKSGVCFRQEPADPEGICCDQPCDDICESCLGAKTGLGDGTCALVPAGTGTKTDCQQDVEFELVCDANGNVVAGQIQLCAPYACIATRCRDDQDGCTTNGDCSADGWCTAAGKCAPKQDVGTECEGDDDQCKAVDGVSGHCVDGRCCNAACDGQCEACDLPGSPGFCGQVEGPPRPQKPACDGTGTECEGTCGTKTTECDYLPKACGTGTCAGGVYSGGVCHQEANGACGTAEISCEAYACDADGKACLTSCTTTAECAAQHVCTNENVCAQVAMGRQCDLDHTVVSSNAGEPPEDCTPYRCSGSACLKTCSSIDECVAPAVCDTEGHCVDPPPAPTAPAGCSAGPARAERGLDPLAWLVLAAAIAGVAAGRRRARRDGGSRA